MPERLAQRIALVSMPFASCKFPSLALSILKPSLQQASHTVSVHYYNQLYADMVGRGLYEELCADQAFNVGEQAFAQLLFPERSDLKTFESFIVEGCPLDVFASLVQRAKLLVDFAATQLILLRPNLVGFTTTFYQKMAALALARELRRRNCDATIVFGGAACESPMGEALIECFSELDAVFHGDAESSLLSYVSILDRTSDLNYTGNISVRQPSGKIQRFRDSSTANSSRELRTPCPDHTDFVRAVEANPMESWFLSYESSRGCWWGEKNHCTFCGLNGDQMLFRRKSVGDIVADLERIRDQFGPVFVQFTDNILHPSFIKELMPRLQRIEGQKYFFEVKANLRESDFCLLAQAGVSEIQPGIERLNDNALLLMRKGTTAIQNAYIIRVATEYGIHVAWNIIWGFPGEEVGDVRHEVEFISKLRHLQPPGTCARIRLDRYSPNFNKAAEMGISIVGPSRSERNLFYNIKGVNDLAYHFDFEYLERPTMELLSGWRDLEYAVDKWKADYVPATLVQFDELDSVVIRDLRDKNFPHEVVLNGKTAQLYRAITAPVSVKVLGSRHGQDADVILDALVARGLAVVNGGKALALAVRDSETLLKRSPSPDPPVWLVVPSHSELYKGMR
jgi:ribosomal peptide maturation radical SAM protein 1